uniref:Reticulon domain-containing protein n=1 Tax=Chenopodium quinoa TaxID=63459 RepID=A0A803MVX0_CHEQI
MESITPPQYHKSEPIHKIKSASRLALMANNPDYGSDTDNQIPHFSVEYAPSPSLPKHQKTPSSTPSKSSINKPKNFLPLHEHLLLSPSPVRKSRTRLSDRLETADDSTEHRRRCKTRTSSNGLTACYSPRNLRRSRRKMIDAEERDIVGVDEVVKPRRRRVSGKSKKEKITSLPSLTPSKGNAGEECALDHLGQIIWELIMWRDVAKSTLWFGFGCLCILSSCFTKGLNIRESTPRNVEVSLKEDDILRAIRVLLPALNLVISKTRELFSGEPSMTLKVALFLLVGSAYGHLLTLWRLCALGFLTSFTAPKLYFSYAAQIDSKAEQCKLRVLEAWRACYHKKIVAASAVSAFWSLSSVKTRIIAVTSMQRSDVTCAVLKQVSETKLEEPSPTEEEVQPGKRAVIDEEEKEPEKALVVADGKSNK